MSRPRKSVSYPPATDYPPPAAAFFAVLCGALGGGRPQGPLATPQAAVEAPGAVSEVPVGAARIAAAFGGDR